MACDAPCPYIERENGHRIGRPGGILLYRGHVSNYAIPANPT